MVVYLLSNIRRGIKKDKQRSVSSFNWDEKGKKTRKTEKKKTNALYTTKEKDTKNTLFFI